MKKIIILFCLFFFTYSFALSPQIGGTLVFGKSGDASTLDPSHVSDGESFHVATSVYDTLVQFKYGTTKIEAALAKSWTISSDGLEYVFYLRKGVYFSKTKYFRSKSEFTSADVLFSFKRQFDKSHAYNKIGGAYIHWHAMDMDNIVKDVIALGRYTVKIILKRKEAPFLANLGMEFVSILSNDYANHLLNKNKTHELSTKPVGTGPFVFKKWIKDDKFIFLANEDYWDGRPYLNKLVFKIITNSSIRAQELKNESIHIMDFPNPKEIKDLEKHKNIKLIKQEGLNVAYLAFNTEKKPFDNKLVRQAISYAINAQKIVDNIYDGLGKVAHSPLPPTMWSYNSNIKRYDYNITKAKDLMKEAGYENGFETNIWAMPVSRAYNPNGRKVARFMKNDLKKIGIKVKIISYDWSTYLKKVANGEHDMVLLGWTGGNADPDDFLNVLLSKHGAMKKPSENKAFWKNDEITLLLDKAKQVTNIKERTILYKKAQEIFAIEAPWKLIAHSLVIEPMLKKVHGFKLDPLGKRRFKEVWLER